MTTTAIREKLYEYIKDADDQKIKNLYSIFEDQMAPAVDWSEDEEFVAELDERVRRYETGIDKAYSIEEVKDFLQKAREDRNQNSSK